MIFIITIIFNNMANEKPKITFNYQKSKNYQNHNIDGLYGGVLPTGSIWFDVFIEKGVIPDTVISEVNQDGNLQDVEKSQDTNNKILRELQCGFTLNLTTAKTIRSWLDKKIKTIESAEKQTNKK